MDESKPLYTEAPKTLKRDELKELKEELKEENPDEPSYNYGISKVKIPTQKQDTYTAFEYNQRMTPTNSGEEVKYSELIKTPALSTKSSRNPKGHEKTYKPFIASFI